MTFDLIRVVETAYRLDLADQDWLDELVDAARPGIDEGLGLMALYYDASDLSNIQTLAIKACGHFAENVGVVGAIQAEAGPEVMRDVMWTGGCASASQIFGRQRFAGMSAFRAGFSVGYLDFLQVNATDPSGVGCMLGVPRPAIGNVARKRATTWNRISSHLRAGLRLRHAVKRLGRPEARAEAILDPSGKAQHLEGGALEAREALREAAVAVDRARSRAGRDDADVALGVWTALVAGRWSLVDHFESDGRRFLVAVPNEPNVQDPRALSLRERQVVAFAALGQSNKLIAYELGLAPSRVATHLSSAQRKIGVGSRVELVTLVRAMATASRSAPPADRDAPEINP